MGLDEIQNQLFDRNPLLRVFYAMSDQIIESETKIDLGAINKMKGKSDHDRE